MTNIQLVNNEGKSKESIKYGDTFSEIQLFLKPTIEPSLLCGDVVAKFYAGSDIKSELTTEVNCRLGRCDESEIFLSISAEQYEYLKPKVYAIELHLDFGDKGYAIYPSPLPFYLTIDPSFKSEA